MRIFTLKNLAEYDGKNGKPAYVAYKGKVYDVTDSFLWQDGRHQVFHSAGTDLTTAIEQAPHSGKVLARFPVVGILQEAGTRGSNEAKTRKRKPIQRASGKRQVTQDS
jgi:predicted heme/steroid binding protein